MTIPQDNYSYKNDILNFTGATLRVSPGFSLVPPPTLPEQDAAVSAALSLVDEPPNTSDFSDDNEFDFFQQKNEIAKDKTNLILTSIQERATLRNESLIQLYDELLKIDNWRMERPFPENYIKDKIWLHLNKMELKVREQIRRELQDTLRDTAFSVKDLREGALEYKKLQHRQSFLGGGLEEAIEDTINNQTGDIYQN